MPDDADTNGSNSRNTTSATASVTAAAAKQQQPNKSDKQRKRELKAQNTRANDQLDSPALVNAITAAARTAASTTTTTTAASSTTSTKAPTPVTKLDNRTKNERPINPRITNPSIPTNPSIKTNSLPRSAATRKPQTSENAQTYNPALAASLAFKKSDQPKNTNNNATSAAKAQKLFTDIGATESAALDAAKSSSVVSSAMASVVTTPATDGSNSSRTAAMRSVASLSAQHLSDSEKDDQKKSQMVNAAVRNVGELSSTKHTEDTHSDTHSKLDVESTMSSKTSLAAAKWMAEKSGKDKAKESTGSKAPNTTDDKSNAALAAALKARTNADEKEREREEAQVFAPIPVRHRPPAFVLEQSPPVHGVSSIVSNMRRYSSSGAPPPEEMNRLSSDSSASFGDFPSNWASQNVSADSLLLAPEGPLQRKFKSPIDGTALAESRLTPNEAYPKRRSLDDRPAIRAAAMKANALMPHAVSSPTPPLGTVAAGQQKQKHSGLFGKLGHRKSNKNLREPTPQQTGGLKTTMRKEARKRLFNEDKPWKHHRDARLVTELERKRYEGVWAANKGIHLPFMYQEPRLSSQDYDPANDVHGIVVRELWRRSRLSEDILERIWDLVDGHGNGCLDREEFLVGMWLVDQCLYGRKLPQVVDRNVWNSVARLSVQIKFHKGKH